MVTTEPLLTAAPLTRAYAGQTALHLEDFAVYPGEVVALIGPSGAGKSTLLRILCLADPGYVGRLVISGRDVATLSPSDRLALRRRLAMVLQKPAVFRASVAENVAYPLRLRGVGRAARNRRVAGALEMVGLSAFTRRAARSLSGGEAQRLSLARALVAKPELLFLDEPTANLDPTNAAAVEATVRNLKASGTTVVIATHNMFQARRLADRVLVLWDGEGIEWGSVDEVFGSPRDQRTKAFLEGTAVY